MRLNSSDRSLARQVTVTVGRQKGSRVVSEDSVPTSESARVQSVHRLPAIAGSDSEGKE